jgi:hypothetical protein
MFVKLNEVLRKNAWLLMTGFSAFVGSGLIGFMAAQIETKTPAIWLAIIGVMLAYGVIIMVSVAIESLQRMTGND